MNEVEISVIIKDGVNTVSWNIGLIIKQGPDVSYVSSHNLNNLNMSKCKPCEGWNYEPPKIKSCEPEIQSSEPDDFDMTTPNITLPVNEYVDEMVTKQEEDLDKVDEMLNKTNACKRAWDEYNAKKEVSDPQGDGEEDLDADDEVPLDQLSEELQKADEDADYEALVGSATKKLKSET